MNLKKVTGKDISIGAPMILGAGAGVMVTRGISGSITASKTGDVLTDDQKKKKMYVGLAALAIGAYGFMAVNGTDSASTALKGASLGASLNGLLDVAAYVTEKSNVKPDANTATGRFYANALGCPCDNSGMAYTPYARAIAPASTYAPLRMPTPQAEVLDLSNMAQPITDLAQLS